MSERPSRTFVSCLGACLEDQTFIERFDELHGTNFTKHRGKGAPPDEWLLFCRYVKANIFEPLKRKPASC